MTEPGLQRRAVLVNDHFHDAGSADASGSLEENCREAVRAGVTHLCLTNHVESPAGDGAWSVVLPDALARFRTERRAVEENRARFPSLHIRLGAEFEYRPEWTSPLDDLRARVPLDFVIGSVHDVDGLNVSGGRHAEEYFGTRGVADAYGRYFESLGEMVEWGGFDVVGHFDLVKRYGHRYYGPYCPGDFEGTIRAVLRRMAARGIGIEINTSGLFQPPASCYPHPDILRWAREEEVPYLTLGSDSHRPEDFARGLAEGLETARRAGWDSLTLFEGREPRWIEIGVG